VYRYLRSLSHSRWRRRPVGVALALTWAAPVAEAQTPSPAGVTAFVGVAVVPMDTERVLRDHTVLLGTDDAGADGTLPGVAVHRELQLLVKAGLTPYQALATGTRNMGLFVKTFFHTRDETGTIAVGQRADLVLLQQNPLEDIRHTRQPAGVMVGGRWLPRAELDRRLAAIWAANPKGRWW
jgi:adenine deaminase